MAPAVAERIEEAVQVSVKDIVSSSTQPRQTFETAELEQSIAQKGIIQPLLLRPKGTAAKSQHEIVDGERRWRAAMKLGLETVPALIREYSDAEVLEIQLISAIHRADLTPLERSAAYHQLIAAKPTKENAATIAARVGLPVSAVWDLLLLKELVPEATQLLAREKFTVEHAVLIAALTPAQQKELVEPGGDLWKDDHGFDFATQKAERSALKADKWADLKPCSVNELRRHIRDHIRFNPARAAATQPFMFEQTAQLIESVQKIPGRKKMTAWITFDYHVNDAAKDPNERTYGKDSWKRADGKEKSKKCDHSVLGIVAAGRGQGETFEVCVNREKCLVHWADVVKRKQKNATLRAKGQGAKAAANEAKQRAKEEEQRQQQEREERLWEKLEPLLIADAVQQIKSIKTLTAKTAQLVLDEVITFYSAAEALKKHLGAGWFKTPVAALLTCAIEGDTMYDGFDGFVDRAKKMGLDIKRFEAIRDKHTPKPEPKPDAKAENKRIHDELVKAGLHPKKKAAKK